MTKKMSRWGVGPIFASLSIGYVFLMLLFSKYYQPLFQFCFIPYWLLRIVGILLIIIGTLFFIISVKAVMQAYNSDKLVTKGVYHFCRHPLYASWVIFIVPGIVFLANSWLCLTAPVFMYFLLRKLVTKEETYLESVFGTNYLDYKKNVPCILPYGLIKKTYNKSFHRTRCTRR